MSLQRGALRGACLTLQDEHLEGAAPVLGIAASVGGYSIMELNQDLLTVTVTEGLTEDAISARLHDGEPGVASPAVASRKCRFRPLAVPTRNQSKPTACPVTS